MIGRRRRRRQPVGCTDRWVGFGVFIRSATPAATDQASQRTYWSRTRQTRTIRSRTSRRLGAAFHHSSTEKKAGRQTVNWCNIFFLFRLVNYLVFQQRWLFRSFVSMIKREAFYFWFRCKCRFRQEGGKQFNYVIKKITHTLIAHVGSLWKHHRRSVIRWISLMKASAKTYTHLSSDFFSLPRRIFQCPPPPCCLPFAGTSFSRMICGRNFYAGYWIS